MFAEYITNTAMNDGSVPQ